MDRFFSKLDLRDIKIDPQGASFPPDAEEVEVETEVAEASMTYESPVMETVAEEAVIQHPHDDVYVFDADPVAPATNGHAEAAAAVATREWEAPNGNDGAENGAVRHGDVLKVSARSRPSAVAGAIAGVVRESGRAEVQAIGAGATNQAVKAVAIARDYLRETGIEAVCLPSFIDVMIDNEDRTAILLVVEPR